MLADAATVLLGILLVLLILISVVGNILVCVAIATEKQLRKLSNLFLVSLAIADLLVAAFVMPFALLNDLGTWRLGEAFCKMWISSDVMCSTASIVNLCAISLDRFIHIKDPLQYTELITRRSVPITIVTIWVTSALISFLPISLNLHATSSDPQPSSDDHCALDFNPSYSIITSFISFFLPCFIMLFIYFHVYNFARYHMECIREQSKPLLRLRRMSMEQRLERNPEMETSDKANKARKKMKVTVADSPLLQEHKAAITIGIIMGVFLLCWTPFFIVNVVSGLCKDCISATVFKVLTWLGYSNSAFNPIIYSIFNMEFREAFHRILTQRVFCGTKTQPFDV